MRILFVLSRVPYPLQKGDKLRAFHLIRELSKKHEVALFCLSEDRVNEEAREKLRQHCHEVYIHRIPPYQRWINLLFALFSDKPFQVAYFYSNRAQLAFDAFIEEQLPQHIFCQLTRTSEYIRKYRVFKKTIDYMDAFSAGMKRMAEKAVFPLSIVMKMEHLRLKKYEQEIAEHFDHHTIISKQDKACIQIAHEILVLPNGVAPQFFEERAVAKTRDLLFTGNMSYRPNVESAKFLAQKVMPLVWQSEASVKLTLAGANPSNSVKSLKSERIEVTGWVDDIVEVYQSAKLFVAPMLINSGLQNKLLEAMACKIACVTTDLANNALGAKPDEEIVIGNNAREVADAILSLLKDDQKRSSIALAGSKHVTAHYSWTKEAQRLEEIMVGEA